MEHPLITQVNKHGYVNEEQQYEASETIDMSYMLEIEAHVNDVRNAEKEGVLGYYLHSGEAHVTRDLFETLVNEYKFDANVKDREEYENPVELSFEYKEVVYITIYTSQEYTGKADRE